MPEIKPRFRYVFILSLATVFIIISVLAWPGCESHEDTYIDFNLEIRPVLNQSCLACHGGVRQSGGFSMLFPEEVFYETDSGKPAIVPGDPDASELIRRVTHHDPEIRMPMEADPLTGTEIENLRRWIEQGASWDDHWAYIAPKTKELPKVRKTEWPANGIDYFILSRLEMESLRPSGEASCGILMRRLSLDLIGLPPDLNEVTAFCEDPSDDAFDAQVDRLLESPHFGERWAAMWLDLARYADSKGYEADQHRTIWRYRDWVINAFNRDLPFDRFTIEQIAGDLLPGPDDELMIATAFHRNTMTNSEGGTDAEEFRVAAVIDRVNTTWEIWQGTTMACVQCHSHPYDPFRHEEYFKVYDFFNHTEDANYSDESPVLTEYAEGQFEKITLLQARLDSLEQIQKKSGMETEEKTLASYDSTAIAELIAWTKEKLKENAPVTTPVMKELPDEKRRTTRVFDGGNWLAQTYEVQADVPGVMPPMPEDAPRNRLGLAEWLVSPENPLTSRVIVNRFWNQLFGRGIVETIEDFGTQGSLPSHPDLLDWLALRFMEHHEWSVKALLKEIVTSATYRQSSNVSPHHLEKDPENRLLARGPRFRLSAEQIRDQALAVSGLYAPEMFGPSVMPPQPGGIWRNPYSSMKWITAEDENRYRRGLYTYWRRTAPYPSMLTFDATSREVCVSRRIRTNTPLQALVLLNDPVYVEAALALAVKMQNGGGDDPDSQLSEGYFKALARYPGETELSELRMLYNEALQFYNESPDEAAALLGVEANPDPRLASLALSASAILNLDTFVMKE